MAFNIRNLINNQNKMAANFYGGEDEDTFNTEIDEVFNPFETDYYHKLLDLNINKLNDSNPALNGKPDLEKKKSKNSNSKKQTEKKANVKNNGLIVGNFSAEQNDNAEEEEQESFKDQNESKHKLKLLNYKSKLTRLKKYTTYIKIIDTLAAMLATVGVSFAFIENEVYIANNYVLGSSSEFLKMFISLSSVLLSLMIVARYIVQHQLDVLRVICLETKFLKTKRIYALLFEFLLNLLHVPYGVAAFSWFWNLDREVRYSLNDIVVCIMLLRFYLVLRLFAIYSIWLKDDAIYFCQLNGCEANTAFALKATLRERPFIIMLFSIGKQVMKSCFIVLIVSSVAIFGLMVRTFERPYYSSYRNYVNIYFKPDDFQDYNTIWNCIWLVIVTMATVGYGDFYPKTHPGRTVIAISSFFGLFITSLVIVALSSSSNFSSKETRAFDMIWKLRSKKVADESAALLIALRWKIYILMKKREINEYTTGQMVILMTKYRKTKLRYNIARTQMRSNQNHLIANQLQEFAEKIQMDIQNLNSQLVTLKETADQVKSIQSYNYQLSLTIDKHYRNGIQILKMLEMIDPNKPVVKPRKAVVDPVKLANEVQGGNVQSEIAGIQESKVLRNLRTVTLKLRDEVDFQRIYGTERVELEPLSPLGRKSYQEEPWENDLHNIQNHIEQLPLS